MLGNGNLNHEWVLWLSGSSFKTNQKAFDPVFSNRTIRGNQNKDPGVMADRKGFWKISEFLPKFQRFYGIQEAVKTELRKYDLIQKTIGDIEVLKCQCKRQEHR